MVSQTGSEVLKAQAARDNSYRQDTTARVQDLAVYIPTLLFQVVVADLGSYRNVLRRQSQRLQGAVMGTSSTGLKKS